MALVDNATVLSPAKKWEPVNTVPRSTFVDDLAVSLLGYETIFILICVA